jgi:hypothetical protein
MPNISKVIQESVSENQLKMLKAELIQIYHSLIFVIDKLNLQALL